MKGETILKVILSGFLVLSVFNNLQGQGAYLPPDKPRLVIGIVVEQLRYDQLEKFRNRFSENGIRKLLNEVPIFRMHRSSICLPSQLRAMQQFQLVLSHLCMA